MRHTVAISDIHLSQLEPSHGLWMRYRQANFIPDRELIAMLGILRLRVQDAELELVFNGDVFDFDSPWIEQGETKLPTSRRDAATAVSILRGMLRDHAEFVRTLGTILSDGKTIIFVSGNHDVELTFEDVRAVLRDSLFEAALHAGSTESQEAITSRIVFRSWIYLNRDNILFEHGHQYDELNCFRTIMLPSARDGKNIAPTFGSLLARYFSSRLGYFNPHVDESFALSFQGYVRHWMMYYLFSSRSLAMPFIQGMSHIVIELIRNRKSDGRNLSETNVDAAAHETGLPIDKIRQHLAAGTRPVEANWRRFVLKLGLDRFVFGFIAIVLSFVWFRYTHGRLAYGALFPFALFIGYTFLVPRKTSLEYIWSGVQQKTRELARIHDARAVVFGHTHRPEGTWENGVFYGNTGSWSAAYADVECSLPISDHRPLIWITRITDDAPLIGGLVTWKDGSFLGHPLDS